MRIGKVDISSLTPEDEERFLRLAAARGASFDFDSLEELVASPDGFGLTTISPLQRALCRLIEGRPLGALVADDELRMALGVTNLQHQYEKPTEVIVLAAVRTAKSMIAAANAIWSAQTVKFPRWIKDGEVPRYSILSLELDNARVVLSHLLGGLSRPKLEPLRVPKKQEDLLTEVGAEVVGSVHIYNREGRIVEIRVVAGKKAGGSLVSRWSIGATLDEAPRMVGSSEAVINYDDSHRAVRSRLLPGAQILSIGSPWQPFGPIYDLFHNEFGKPSSARLIFRGTGPQLNPEWWNAERVASLRDSKNRNDQLVYQTDVLAQFADEEEMLFSQALLSKCVQQNLLQIDYLPRHDYVAAIDPATRGNAWTLVVCSRKGRLKKVVYAKEWRGKPNEPLSPRQTLREVAAICRSYNLDWAYTDQWAADHNKEMALEEGFALVDIDWTDAEKVDTFTSLASAIADGTVHLLDNSQLLRDLKMVKKKPTNKGFSIHLPSTTDGRHCDFAPPLARCLKQWIDDEQPAIPDKGTPEWDRHYEEQMTLEAEERFQKRNVSFEEELWQPDPWETWEREKQLIGFARQLALGNTVKAR